MLFIGAEDLGYTPHVQSKSNDAISSTGTLRNAYTDMTQSPNYRPWH
jgi:hypothetical protein